MSFFDSKGHRATVLDKIQAATMLRSMMAAMMRYEEIFTRIYVYDTKFRRWLHVQFDYFSLKRIGIVNRTWTGLPSCMPGVQSGMRLTSRNASLSRLSKPAD